MASWRPTPQPPETCYCGEPIPAEGPSDLYCTETCQTRWAQTGHDYLPVPARPEWRMGASEGDWRRQMAWPDVPALPPQDVGQWIERTDPAPVEPPPEPEWVEVKAVTRYPLPPVSESCYPPGAVDLPVEYAMVVTPWWRKILGH